MAPPMTTEGGDKPVKKKAQVFKTFLVGLLKVMFEVTYL